PYETEASDLRDMAEKEQEGKIVTNVESGKGNQTNNLTQASKVRGEKPDLNVPLKGSQQKLAKEASQGKLFGNALKDVVAVNGALEEDVIDEIEHGDKHQTLGGGEDNQGNDNNNNNNNNNNNSNKHMGRPANMKGGEKSMDFDKMSLQSGSEGNEDRHGSPKETYGRDNLGESEVVRVVNKFERDEKDKNFGMVLDNLGAINNVLEEGVLEDIEDNANGIVQGPTLR
ncbi:hypothetical protein RFI_21316, partial [Reticulomyxa filosa]